MNRILEGAPDSGLDRTKVRTREQIERYAQDGYLFPVPALTRREADEARATLEAFEAEHGGAWPRHVHHKPHLLLTWVDGLVRHPAILDAVEDIVGPDILCWSSRFFLKNPHDGGFVSWHQDLPYWGLDMSEKVLTVWLALTPANRANGVMKVIPRSHNKLVLHKEAAANNLLRRGQEVAVEVDELQAVCMELGAGEISLHHGLIFHGSEENRSSERRIGFAIRYIPARISPLAGLPRIPPRWCAERIAMVISNCSRLHCETWTRARWRPSARRARLPAGYGISQPTGTWKWSKPSRREPVSQRDERGGAA